jgi:hypothetical protein
MLAYGPIVDGYIYFFIATVLLICNMARRKSGIFIIHERWEKKIRSSDDREYV